MAGLEKVPLRIPSQWDPAWFEKFVRDFLSLADVRNAIPGNGITITGNSATNATLSSSGPPGSIANAQYTLLAPEADLPNARILTAAPGIIDLNDAGAGDALTIGLVHGGVDDVFLRIRAALSVMGRPQDTTGTTGDIVSAGDKSVLHQSGTALAFDITDSSYVSDFVEAAQDAVGAALTNTATVHLTYTDASNQVTADVQPSATLDTLGSARGNILYRGASGWSALAPGTSGNVLRTNGPGADPDWVPVSAGSGALAPALIAGLAFWFETDLIAFPSGGIVYSLCSRDPSRAAPSAVAVSGFSNVGATVSSSALNSLPTIDCPGSSNSDYTLSQAPVLAQATIFAVFKCGALAGGASYSIIGGPNAALQFRVSTDTASTDGHVELTQDNTAIIGAGTTHGISLNTWYQANCTYNVTGGAYAFRVGQASAGSGTNSKSITADSRSVFYDLGNGSSQHFNGSVATLIVYSRVLTLTEIQAVEAYLHSKWGV